MTQNSRDVTWGSSVRACAEAATEFIAACLQSYNYLQENHLRSAFAYFDQDNSGTISAEELRQCLASDDFTLNEEQI